MCCHPSCQDSRRHLFAANTIRQTVQRYVFLKFTSVRDLFYHNLRHVQLHYASENVLLVHRARDYPHFRKAMLSNQEKHLRLVWESDKKQKQIQQITLPMLQLQASSQLGRI